MTKMKIFACEVMGIKIEKKGCFEFISEGIFGKYSKMKVLVLNFETPSTNFFFALIKKIFLQTLVEIIFRYHKIFLGFWDPLGPPYEQNKNCLHVRSWVSKWCKKGALSSFLKEFWGNIQNEGFGPKFWDPQYKFFLFCS